jgi:hypothetical protein
MSTTPADVETRLAELERSLRRWRLASVAAVGLAVLALLLAARPDLTGEVRANKFALLNDLGEDVGGLGFDDHGEPRLGFKLSRNNGTVVVGSLVEDVAGVAVNGKDASILIGTDSTGSPALSLRADKKTISLGIVRGNDPALLLVAGPTNLGATSSGIRIRQESGDEVLLPEHRRGAAQAPAGPTKEP